MKSGPKRTQVKLYGFFPFAEKFGALFCAAVTEKDIVKKVGLEFDSPHSNKTSPSQVTATLTQRIFYAYMANHMDFRGPILDLSLAHYQTFVSRNGFSSSELERLSEVLKELDLSYYYSDGSNKKGERIKFIRSGIPFWFTRGVEEIRIVRRDDPSKEKWCNFEDIVTYLLKAKLEYSAPKANPIEIERIGVNYKLEDIRDSVVYLAGPDCTPVLEKLNLKNIGSYQDEGLEAFVKRKF